MKCLVLEGRAFRWDAYNKLSFAYSAEIAFVHTPTPSEIAESALAIMQKIVIDARNEGEFLIDFEMEWEVLEGSLWDFMSKTADSLGSEPHIIRRPQSKRDDSFGAGVAGFLIGVGIS